MSAASAAIRDEAVCDVPLVVDVDGTLIKSDLLYESALQFLARFPFEAWRLPHWLFTCGKAELKRRLAERADPSVATIPLRGETVAVIRDAQLAGRRVYLASASDGRLVEALADRIGGIAGVFSTEAGVNLAGAAKAQRLVAELGAKGFDYVGDAPRGFPGMAGGAQRAGGCPRCRFLPQGQGGFPGGPHRRGAAGPAPGTSSARSGRINGPRTPWSSWGW